MPSNLIAPGGFLIGGKTDYYSEDSSQYYYSKSWGYQTYNNAYMAQGHWENPLDLRKGISYTYLHFTLNPDQVDAYVVVGGQEIFSPLRQTGEHAVEFAWGEGQGQQSVDLGIATLAYHEPWGYGTGRISFFVKPAATRPPDGYVIVGGRIMSRDLASTGPYITSQQWGHWDGDVVAQDIGVGQSWTQAYGWGFSLYTVAFQKAF